MFVGLLARSQYPEGPATGHLGTGFSCLQVNDEMVSKTTICYCMLLIYVVWQKRNETDFILTINFILFTNQGCPLQNSSIGQLHSNEGVVSIVHSSAGRLLQLYLSARRLPSTGYYQKYQNGAIWSVFWAEGIKRSHRYWDPANKGAEEPQECFFLPKIHSWRLPCDMGRCRCAASTCMQCLVAHVPSFSWVFQGISDKRFDWQFVLVAQIPCGRSPDCQKNKWASIWFWICSFSLSWDGDSLQCATPDFGVLSRGPTPKSMILHLW